MDVSLVTSLYRSAGHLAGFLEQMQTCLNALQSRDCSAESIIISNAPDKLEERILATAFGSKWWREHGSLITVPRETVYASWNRGVRAANGSAVGFWNVDDYRNPNAIVEGIELIREGHAVVRFPWLYVGEKRRARSGTKRVVVLEDGEKLTRLDPRQDFCLGPFFLVDRQVFEDRGPFDEQFHIAGDYDWQLRVAPHVGLAEGSQLGGVFFVDGMNLSGSGSERLHVEQNVIIVRHALHRPLWPLDARAKQLLGTYRVDMSADFVHPPEWSYERQWRHGQLPRRVYGRCRRIAGMPRRLAASWDRRAR